MTDSMSAQMGQNEYSKDQYYVYILWWGSPPLTLCVCVCVCVRARVRVYTSVFVFVCVCVLRWADPGEAVPGRVSLTDRSGGNWSAMVAKQNSTQQRLAVAKA